MWRNIIQRTQSYQQEHRHHLLIDLGLIAVIGILGGAIVYMANSIPAVDVPPIKPPPLAGAASVLQLESYARYFAFGGEQIGRGPIPLQVGARTTYWIFVRTGAEGGAVEDVTMNVALPDRIEYTGQGSALGGYGWFPSGDGRSLSWDIGTLDVGQSLEGAFEVAAIPSESDAGKRVELVTSVEVTGRDLRGRKIKQRNDPIQGDLVK